MYDSDFTRRAVLGGTAGAVASLVTLGATGTAAAQETVTIRLVDFAFEPGTEDPLEIPPGTTVQFVWETDTHNIAVTERPDESDWEGHTDIEDTGFEYEHTFEVEGEYEFVCTPHETLGMIGRIIVDPDAEAPVSDDPLMLRPIPDTGVLALFGIVVASIVAAFGYTRMDPDTRPPSAVAVAIGSVIIGTLFLLLIIIQLTIWS